MASDKDKIIARIHRRGPGAAFTPKDFLDVASRGTVDMTLAALLADGTIRRLARGLYDYPRTSTLLEGPTAPDLDQVSQALARRYRWNIIPDGPLAANLLGLSTQVPARSVYISDGPTKTIKIGRQTIHFKNARPKETGVASVRSGTVIQALRHLGRRRVGDKVVEKLRRFLSAKEKRALVHDARQSADWIYAAARAIADEPR
jgi:uncharacterized protein DUF6088